MLAAMLARSHLVFWKLPSSCPNLTNFSVVSGSVLTTPIWGFLAGGQPDEAAKVRA